MKIRLGFVSNSSSSSFMIVGYEIGNIYSCLLPQLDFENKTYVLIGKNFSNDDGGVDLIELDEKMFDWFKKHQHNTDVGDGTVIEVVKSLQDPWNNNNCKIVVPNNLNDANVWYINTPRNHSRSVKDLIKNYITE